MSDDNGPFVMERLPAFHPIEIIEDRPLMRPALPLVGDIVCREIKRANHSAKTILIDPHLEMFREFNSLGETSAGTARGSATPAGTLGLHRGARHRAVGAEHAAIAWLRPQLHSAARAHVNQLTSVRRHGLGFRCPAMRTGNDQSVVWATIFCRLCRVRSFSRAPS